VPPDPGPGRLDDLQRAQGPGRAHRPAGTGTGAPARAPATSA
jgi:hypothetical protein